MKNKPLRRIVAVLTRSDSGQSVRVRPNARFRCYGARCKPSATRSTRAPPHRAAARTETHYSSDLGDLSPKPPIPAPARVKAIDFWQVSTRLRSAFLCFLRFHLPSVASGSDCTRNSVGRLQRVWQSACRPPPVGTPGRIRAAVGGGVALAIAGCAPPPSLGCGCCGCRCHRQEARERVLLVTQLAFGR